MRRRWWRRIERAFCWYVFIEGPDGEWIPIVGYWRRKRGAQEWVDAHGGRLEIHRYGWKP